MRLWPRKPVYVDDFPKTHDLRFAAIFLVLLGLLLGAVYAVGFLIAGDRLPSRTTVAGVDVGGMRRAEARTELQSKLVPRLDEPISAVVLGKTFVIHPQRAGLTFDVEATLSAGLAGDRWDPRHMLHVLMGGEPIAPVLGLDDGELDTTLSRIARRIERPAVDARVTFGGGTPRYSGGQAGVTLDDAASRLRLLHAFATGDERITFPVKAVPPEVSAEAASTFVTRVARPAVTGEVRIRVADSVLTVQPRLFAPALRARVGQSGLELTIDQSTLMTRSHALIARLPHRPVNARFDFAHGRPVIVPSRTGATVDSADWATAVLHAIGNRGEQRRAVAPVTPEEPRLTTADARQLRVRSRVSATELRVPRSLAAAARTAARRLDGAVTRPGERFSFVQQVGGGNPDAASVVASAAYATAFSAGMSEFLRTSPHVPTPGAPLGLDAAIRPGVDLRWTNPTPFGIYVRAAFGSTKGGPGTVRVEFWSTRFATVTSKTTSPYHRLDPVVHRVRSPGCRPQSGQVGFDVDVKRTLVHPGRQPRVETFHSRYAPAAAVVCVSGGRR